MRYRSAMNTVTLDEIDRGLVHALQIDGRAPLRTIAEVLEVSENTVARRYRRLRSTGTLRVTGAVNGARLGYVAWTMRLVATPDAASSIANALAARDDTSWIYLLSGGTEICCNTQVRTAADRDDLLLRKLPRTARVTSVSAHELVHTFALPGGWAGLHALPEEKAARLRPPPPADDDAPLELEPGDQALFDLLAVDGRATYTELAARTGWSDATVKRRMAALRHHGVLTYHLDVRLEQLGFASQTRLWMAVSPSGLEEVGHALASHPETSFVVATTGATNLTAMINCRSGGDLYRYLTRRVAPLTAIRTLETAPVIRTVKRTGSPLPR
ncbi:Lrp/AsnC family transcriptional regulator [Amycolatopsis minnesotensis]|uniref:Lrp/AsnC family transcriptional regulator n=2 Tax=Amycolatopsis minnesotensis TaxID=337894 RepID=A0ABN2QUD4_9PSEU